MYIFARRDGQEGLIALDASNGREEWRSVYPAPYTPATPAAAHGASPKATPLFHENRLFTLGISGVVTAFDARTGARLWQTPPPKEAPFYGAAVSPLGMQDLVIVHPGDYGPLTAFDARTGAVTVDRRSWWLLRVADSGLSRTNAAGRLGDAGLRHRRLARWSRAVAVSADTRTDRRRRSSATARSLSTRASESSHSDQG